jgi:hypothetical protein
MTNKLEALKAAFAAKASSSTSSDDSWKKFYPFWKMNEDQTAIVRFLPDLDEDNPLGFLVENHVHELNINGQRTTVACGKMYGESCPICDLSRKYYDEKNEELGKKYYRKLSYIGQVLVIESPIEHDAEQLVKLIDFGPKIFKLIQAAFQSGDLEVEPYSLVGGYNFRIKKTKSGQYADYGTSSFAPKQTNVDDDIVNRLELYDLKEQRRKHIPRAELEALLHADITGASVAPTTATTQVPATPSVAEVATSTPVATPVAPTETVVAAQATVATEAAPTSGSSALAALRARAKAAKENGAAAE